MCANFLVKATDILRPRIVETVEWKIRGWEGLMIPKRSFLPGMIISPYKAKITCIFKKVTIDSKVRYSLSRVALEYTGENVIRDSAASAHGSWCRLPMKPGARAGQDRVLPQVSLLELIH